MKELLCSQWAVVWMPLVPAFLLFAINRGRYGELVAILGYSAALVATFMLQGSQCAVL